MSSKTLRSGITSSKVVSTSAARLQLDIVCLTRCFRKRKGKSRGPFNGGQRVSRRLAGASADQAKPAASGVRACRVSNSAALWPLIQRILTQAIYWESILESSTVHAQSCQHILGETAAGYDVSHLEAATRSGYSRSSS